MTCHPNNINKKLLALLGLDMKNVIAVDISMRPGEPPKITVDCLLTADPMGEHDVQVFKLQPIDPPPPLDLDTTCQAAMQRVQKVIAKSTQAASTDVARGFLASRHALGVPIRWEHLQCLGERERQCYVELQPLDDSEPSYVLYRTLALQGIA